MQYSSFSPLIFLAPICPLFPTFPISWMKTKRERDFLDSFPLGWSESCLGQFRLLYDMNEHHWRAWLVMYNASVYLFCTQIVRLFLYLIKDYFCMYL